MTPKCPDCKHDQDSCVCIDLHEEIATLTAKLAESQAETREYRMNLKEYAEALHEAQKQLAEAQMDAERLRRGEYICQNCGIRKDAEQDARPNF